MTSRSQHVLIDLIEGFRWDDVEVRMNTEEGREDLRRKNKKCGSLPLHEACQYSAPLGLVEAMVGEYPEAVKMTDNKRRFPLHHACHCRETSSQVVRLLLDTYPEGAKATDQYGFLPLHQAAMSNAPLGIFRMLLNAHPEGTATRNQYGALPVHLLAQVASPGKNGDVEKVDVLLRSMLGNEEACLVLDPLLSCGTPLHIGAQFDLLSLQACLRIRRCPTEVIATVVNRHPGQLRETDESGNLPLHVAAANPNLNGAQDGQEHIIVKMVRLYPDAVAALNGEGRSPLNLAIESGKQWKEGVEAIADAAKGVMTIRDVGTNLFPFMLAASGATPCMTTIYKLLRCCPEKCKQA